MPRQTVSPADVLVASGVLTVDYRDIAPLTRTLKIALLIACGMDLVALLSSVAQQSLLGGEFTQAQADANDLREQVVTYIVIAVGLATVVVFFVWLHRAAANARALGATGLTFTPGWSIGWFFVPIANLFMPLRVMRELWRASHDPAHWATRAAAPIVGWWWFAFLVDEATERLAGILYKNAESVSALQTATGVDIVSDVTSIVAYLVGYVMIARIADAQANARRAAPEPAQAIAKLA